MRKIRYRYVMLIILLIIPASLAWAAGVDVNNDGVVNLVDMQICIKCINGKGSCAGVDVNLDNATDDADLWEVIDYINEQSGGTPTLYFYPSQIDFGSVTVGESNTQNLTLANNGTGRLQVSLKGTGMSGIQAGDFSVDSPVDSPSFPIVLAAKGYKEIKIKCSPSQIGDRTATLLLSTNDPNRENIEYTLHCTGKRAEAVCSLNAPFDFTKDQTVPIPGNGFDSDRDRLKPSSCLNGEPEDHWNVKQTLSIEQITDYEYFSKNIEKNNTIGGNFKISYMGVGLNGETGIEKKFLSEFSRTSLSQSFVYKYEMAGLSQIFDTGSDANPLNDRGNAALKDSCTFRTVCGDEFVYEVKKGVTLFISLTFKFASKRDYQMFSEKVGGKFGVSLNTSITKYDKCTGEAKANLLDISANGNWEKFKKNVTEEIRKNTTITVNALQYGGYPGDLTKIGAGMSCTLDDSNPCRELIASLAGYAASERFAQGAKEYPAVMSYTTQPYNVIGVSAGLNDEITDAILDARERLADEYQKQSTAIDQANYKLTEYARRLTPTEKTALNDFINVLERNRKDLRAAGSVCFSNLPACVAKADDTLKNLRPYDTAMLTLPKPYLITNPQTVQVKKNAEKFCDLPPGYVLTGIGGRIIDDTVKDIRLEGRYLNANGTFGSRKNFRCGDKEDMGSFLSVPNANPNGLDYVIVGFEAHSTGETLTITKILYRPFNPLKGRFYGGVESKQASGKGQLGFRLNQFTKDEDHAIIMRVGLRSDQEKIQGIQVKFGQLQIQ